MKLIQSSAAILLIAFGMNVAMASNWCGYDPTAKLDHANINVLNKINVQAAKAALNKAAQNCGSSTIAGHSSKLSAQLTAWANECPNLDTSGGPIKDPFAKAKAANSCADHYEYLKQANPNFLNAFNYPADYQSYEVSNGPFCDNGTNPANRTDYTNNQLCQCIASFGNAGSSNGGADMRHHWPFSWLSDADIATYKARAKTRLNYVLSLGSNPNNYMIYTGVPTKLSPAQCCVIVGGNTQAVAGSSNPGGVIGDVSTTPATTPTSCK